MVPVVPCPGFAPGFRVPTSFTDKAFMTWACGPLRKMKELNLRRWDFQSHALPTELILQKYNSVDLSGIEPDPIAASYHTAP